MGTQEAMDTSDFVVGEGDFHAQVLSRYKNSMALEHRHLCAVVTAMAEVIKGQGVPATPTAYFAATMSALSKQEQGMCTQDTDDHVLTALCTFLSITLTKISAAVLKSKSSAGLKVLVDVVNSRNLSPGALKPTFTCIAAFIQVADTKDWASILPGFSILLKHCLDQHPKVRKRAHECTADVLRGFQNSVSLNFASEAVTSTFEKLFLSVSQSKLNSSVDKASERPGNTEALQILYLLNLLKLILPFLSGKYMGKILNFFNKLLHLQQPFLSRQILNTLQPLCMNDGAEIPVASFSNLLEKLATLLLEEKAGDESVVAARILERGMSKLHMLDSHSCIIKLPLFFQALAGMLVLEQEEAVYAAGDSLKSLIQTCIDDSIIEQEKQAAESRGGSLNLAPGTIERICITATGLLGYQYSSSWDVCLQIIAILFEKLGSASFTLMASCVQSLADLENLTDDNLPCRKQLHKTVGTAIAAMGPERFLNLMPLNLDVADISNARLWLLPVMRQSIVGAQLSYFTGKIFPMIQRLQSQSKKLSVEGKLTAAKKMEAIVQALWSLFPAFCNFPSDTAQSFGRIAKHLGAVISEEPDLRSMICYGLQVLIKQNKAALSEHVALDVDPEDSSGVSSVNKSAEEKARAYYTENIARENIAAIASYSKNFLPLLFNVFIAAPADKRGVLQSTIGAMASISEKKIVKNFFVSIMQKLLKATKEASDSVNLKGTEPMDLSGPGKEESPSSKRCIFMDLAMSLMQGLDDESVNVLFSAVKPTLQDGDGSVQKKGYKVLAGLCKEQEGFLTSRSNEILELLAMAMPLCHFSAKGQRLNCLQPLILNVFKLKIEDADKVLSSFIGEIVLATKETNIKTRNRAYDILVQIGHSLKKGDPIGSDGKLIQFFTMIVACLAGTTPHMKSAAITAVARLIYEFNDLCYTIPDLLPSILLLLQTKSREIIKSALGFLKVVIARQPVDLLLEHLKTMVESLLLWSDDSKNHFKAKVRVLFEILVRRCGLQAVLAVTPEQHVKLINHIRKMKERKEKKEDDESKSVRSCATTTRQSRWQHTQFFSDDEGEISDENTEQLDVASSRKSRVTARSSGRLRKANKMIPEDDWEHGDEPLDLLDTKKTRSVLSTNKLKRKNYDSDDFDFDPDGRFIVRDDTLGREKSKHVQDEDIDVHSTKSGRRAQKLKANSLANKKRRTETGWAYTGGEYASKKGEGKGDVKRQGKLDPYAYWPLDPKMLNRRESKKAVARKGLASVVKMTGKLRGMTTSEALDSKHLHGSVGPRRMRGKSRFHSCKQRMAVSPLPQPQVFTDIWLSQLSSNADNSPSNSSQKKPLFSWGSSVSVVATLTSDHSGKLVVFQEASSEDDASLKIRCYLHHSQLFKVGPTSQLWMVDDHATSAKPTSAYSKGFGVSFASEEASNYFFMAVHKWKDAGDQLSNGSVTCGKETNRFDRKIESSSAKLYFHYYGQLLHQQNMLQDYIRTGTYYSAVLENYVDFQGRVVVDVGAGSGILSLFAAQAGAKHVYAVEASGMAEHARKLIAGNPLLSSVITVIHGKVEEIELPEKADILISEPMGTLLVNERMLESYVISRDRFLKPNGKMFPSIGRIHLAPFSDEYLHVEIASKALFWQQPNYYGVDLTALYDTAFQGYFSQPVVDAFDPRLLVTPPITHTIDFTKIKEEEFYEINIPLNFTATMATRVHGLACWFDVLFNGSAVPRWLTTAPGAPTTHWYQLRCVLSQPLYVMAGQTITGNLNMVAHSAQSYTLNLTMSVKMWNGPGQAIMQTSSGRLDLKEPYYRLSQPQAYVWAQDQMQQMQQQTQQLSQVQASQSQNEISYVAQQPSPSASRASQRQQPLQGQQQQQRQSSQMQQQQQPVSSVQQYSNH